jgi:hypothetical protein
LKCFEIPARLRKLKEKIDAMIDFEWDVAKATANLRKHRVAFSEATTVLRNKVSITIHDPDHSFDGHYNNWGIDCRPAFDGFPHRPGRSNPYYQRKGTDSKGA